MCTYLLTFWHYKNDLTILYMIAITFIPQSVKWIKSGLLLTVPHMLLIYSSIIYKDFILKVYIVLVILLLLKSIV